MNHLYFLFSFLIDFNFDTLSQNTLSPGVRLRSTCSQLNSTETDYLCNNYNVNQNERRRFFLSYTKETALNAADLCMRSGGYLASITSSYEMKIVVNYTAINAGDLILIGLRADSSVWASGHSSSYRNFFDGEEPTDDKKCVGFEYNSDGDNAKWRYINCNEESQFLCEGNVNYSFIFIVYNSFINSRG